MSRATKIAALAAGICGLVGSALSQQTPPPGAAQQQSGAEIRKAMVWKRFDYSCASDAKVTVYLRSQTAKVLYKDRMYLMKQTVSADGNRYSDGRFVWWGKGSGGFIQEDKPEGNGAMLVKDCKLVEAAKQDPAVISGSVTYRERIALPPTAVLEVKLLEVSKADAPATVIAEQKIATEGKQVPIPFELKLDPAKIDARHRYTVSVRILVGDQLRYVSDTAYPVQANGTSASGMEIIVKAVPPTR